MFRYILAVIIVTTISHRVQAFDFASPILPGPAQSCEHGYADGATKIIDLILETVGVSASFEVRRANVPNAAAAVYQGKRYILYNPSFIVAMDKAAGSRWASIAVLAHEIGHHLQGHTLDGKGSLPAVELEADEFSGFVLRKMGASLLEAQVALRVMAAAKATRTHPARIDRLLAVESGWNEADEQLNDQPLTEKRRSVPAPEESLSATQIVFYVHFTFDPDTKYHVTGKNDLVKLLNQRAYILGKLLSTGKDNYPLAFRTSTDDVLLISRTGKIINQEGEIVGYITR